MGENIVFVGIVLLCGLIFMGIGIAAFRMKRPIHFWSGSVVKTEEVTNVKAYNKANGWMWLGYGSLFVFTALVAICKLTYAGIMLAIVTVPGLFILIGIYTRIEKKYLIKNQNTDKEITG